MTSSPSKHLIDPQLVAFIEGFPRFEMTRDSLPGLREKVSAMRAPEAGNASISQSEIMIPGRDAQPPVRALLFRPSGDSLARGALFYLHPGGFVMGSPEMLAQRAAELAEDHGCIVLCPAYRLAPEAKYPAQIDDLWTALAWLKDNAAELGFDPARIILTGESAGGGLAAALSLRARDSATLDVAGLILVYPMLDDRTGVITAPSPYAGEFGWTEANNSFGWTSILNQLPGSDDVPYLAAAARALDLAGLPPTYILVGALDLFVDEDIDFATRLLAAGVQTGLKVYPGAYHGFYKVEGADIASEFKADFDRIVQNLLT